MALRLCCAVQNYAWGKRGSNSEVALLSAAGSKGFVIQEDLPYAELWMGTHPSGPSLLAVDDRHAVTGASLQSYIAEHPECLGDDVRQCFGDQLPFLFKVLSVNEALSIQAHPNKLLAEELHRQHPDIYKDPNHKPEMAIALTPFQALCGFRPLSEIASFLRRIPELCELIGADAAAPFVNSASSSTMPVCTEEDLRRAFSSLMSSPAGLVKQKLSDFLARLQAIGHESKEYEDLLGGLLSVLNSQFPGDVGCFCLYFLNCMTLQPGDAIFLEANLPHAYLSGDCVECMACSDNVVRAGLTPKFKDVQTLCSMLNYESRPANRFLFPAAPHPDDASTTVYNPPVPDFAVHKIEVHHGRTHQLQVLNSASILLTVSGSATTCADEPQQLGRGTILFIPANYQLNVTAEPPGDVPLVMFRALCCK